MKKLYKSRDSKVIFGVIGGIGGHFDVDPVILRILWVIITVCSGVFPAIIIYLAAAFLIPQKPKEISGKFNSPIK